MGSKLEEFRFVFSRQFFVQLSTFLSLFISFRIVSGGVEIVKPYHPLYVKAGNALSIACETSDRVDLRWLQQTPLSMWTDESVLPLAGSRVVIQSFREEPSGFTRSTLIKRNMSLGDRGTYICKDDTSNYAVWVTVLYITARNLTDRSTGLDPLILECSISGFDSNVPTIDYDWTFEGRYIPHPHYQVAAPVHHSPEHLASVDKYKVTMDDNDLRLEIRDPSSLDGGSYNCTFTLSTNLGQVMFFETIYVNGSLLPTVSIGVEQSVPLHIPLLTFAIVVAVSFIK